MLYHISREDLNHKVLNPRIPKNRYGCEDGKTPRVCFAITIEGCLNAINRNSNTEFNVYIPKERSLRYKLPTKDEVCDVSMTGEVWVLEPVTLIKIATLYVKARVTTDPINYVMINDNKVECDTYNFEVVYD